MARIPRRAKTGIVRNNHPRCPNSLRVANFLDEGASSSIDHEDEGGGPGEHFTVVVHGANGVSRAGIGGGGVTEVGIGVIEGLGDGTSVRGDAEEGFAVVVAGLFVEGFGDLDDDVCFFLLLWLLVL